MSRTIKIYGSSDDLFEIETDHRTGEPDEIGCFSEPAAIKITANGEMGGGVDGLIVFGVHGLVGPGWLIGIAPLDNPNYDTRSIGASEGLPLPGWIKSFGLAENTYSTLLTLEVPDDARIEQILPFDGDSDT